MFLTRQEHHAQQGNNSHMETAFEFSNSPRKLFFFFFLKNPAKWQYWDYSAVYLWLCYHHLLLGNQECKQSSVRGWMFPGPPLALLALTCDLVLARDVQLPQASFQKCAKEMVGMSTLASIDQIGRWINEGRNIFKGAYFFFCMWQPPSEFWK